MLNHATVAITLDTYSYVLPDMQVSAAKRWKTSFHSSTRSLLYPSNVLVPKKRPLTGAAGDAV